MLRIAIEKSPGRGLVLVLAGWVADEGQELLTAEITRHREYLPALMLDLQQVKGIDEAGISLLRRWSGRGLKLRGGSGYIRALLAAEGLDTA
jgi:ABC-type transporter Mla MlaB component